MIAIVDFQWKPLRYQESQFDRTIALLRLFMCMAHIAIRSLFYFFEAGLKNTAVWM